MNRNTRHLCENTGRNSNEETEWQTGPYRDKQTSERNSKGKEKRKNVLARITHLPISGGVQSATTEGITEKRAAVVEKHKQEERMN